jgi:hypothetical protein
MADLNSPPGYSLTPEELAKQYKLDLDTVRSITKDVPDWGQPQPEEFAPVEYDRDYIKRAYPKLVNLSDQQIFEAVNGMEQDDIGYNEWAKRVEQPTGRAGVVTQQTLESLNPPNLEFLSKVYPELKGMSGQDAIRWMVDAHARLPELSGPDRNKLHDMKGSLQRHNPDYSEDWVKMTPDQTWAYETQPTSSSEGMADRYPLNLQQRPPSFDDYLRSIAVAQRDGEWRPGPVGPERNGLITRSLLGGLDEMQGNLYGGGHTLTRLAESVTGANLSGVRDWMREGVERNEAEAARNPAKYNSYTEVDGIGSGIEYAIEQALRSLPHMLPYLAGGGVGGVIGKTALGRVAGGVLGQAATKQAAKKFTGDMVEKAAKDTLVKWGARAGATAGGTIGHAGEIENEMTRAGGYEIPAWQTLAAGVARAGLDTFGMETVLSRVVGETAAKSAMDVAKNVAKGMGIGALAEGPTEAAQEAIAIGCQWPIKLSHFRSLILSHFSREIVIY